MLDLEMLQLQVQFSIQEGGIDKFLDFKSEDEFIRKFFHLTLDEERTNAVRAAVISTCDKLRRKPFFQKRQEALADLRKSLEQFSLRATAQREAETAQQEVTTRGGGLTLSLEDRAHEQDEIAAQEGLRCFDHQQKAETAEQRATALANDEVVLNTLQLERLYKRAEKTREAADLHVTQLKQEHLHVQAARAQTEIDLLDQQRQGLEESVRLKTEELLPWRNKAIEAGSKLRTALNQRTDQLRQDAERTKLAEQAAEAKQQELLQEADTLRQRETAFMTEQTRLEVEEERFQEEQQTLLDDGLLDEEEATQAAIERWSRQAVAHQATAQQARIDAESLSKEEKLLLQTAGREADSVRRLEADLSQKQFRVAAGEAEREAIGQLAVLRRASESEVAAPDAPGLSTALQHIIDSQRQDLDQLTIYLNELEERQRDIQENGVASNSKDVAKVVSRLTQIGVCSATPFNEYISKAIPDAERARGVVTSNPARFMGVSVAEVELDKARGIEANLPELRAPVMVSAAALDPDPLPRNAFVLPASDDSWFNREAAQRLQASLEQRIGEERERHSQWLKLLREAESAAQRLSSYLEQYGDFRLATMVSEAEQLAMEIEATDARREEAEQKANGCRELAEAKTTLAHEEHSASQNAERHVQTLRRFFEKHEANRPYRVERLQALELELSAIRERLPLIADEQLQLANEVKTLQIRHAQIGQDLREVVRERDDIQHFDEATVAPDSSALSEAALQSLRDNYQNAADALNANQRERLGVLHYQLEQTQQKLTQQREAFSRQFLGLERTKYEPYLALDFERHLAELDVNIVAAGHTLIKTTAALAVADSELGQYARGHQPAHPPTEEMLELSDAALQSRIADAQRDYQSAAGEAHAAHNAATETQRREAQARTAAREAAEQAKTLRTALSLPESLFGQQVPLEEDISTQVRHIIDEFQKRSREFSKSREQARVAFDTLRAAVTRPGFLEVEPDIAIQLQQNDFDAACADSERLLQGVDERIGVTQSSLDSMQADFEACLGELANLVNSAITLLNSAARDKKVPAGAPYVGGKAIIKMRSRFHELPQEARRHALYTYLDGLIETGQVPAKSAELVADALRRVHGRPFGIQMLRMVPDEALQYQPVDQISNSGGEGVVMAMLLYLLINQLRAETQAKLKRSGGGPLILDNPFAKATSPAMWRVQRMLAKALDVQLIFATAIQEYNTLGEFGRFNRLRKAGRNSKTGRWHLERVDYSLSPPTEPLA